MRTLLRCALIIAMASFSAQAQSLGDLAKAEATRRATIAQPAKVITDKDLVEVTAPAPGTGEPTATSAASPDVEVPDCGTPAVRPCKDLMGDGTRVLRDEKWWRTEMTQLRLKLDADRADCRPKELLADHLAALLSLAPTGTAVVAVASNLLKARTDVTLCEQATDVDEQLISLQEEDARHAGVPPGWLRP